MTNLSDMSQNRSFKNVWPIALPIPDMHLERIAPGCVRGASGDGVAAREAAGVLRPGEGGSRRGCGRCADCGCESRVEDGES